MLEFKNFIKIGFKLIEQHRPYLIKLKGISFNLEQSIEWFIFSIYTFKINNEYISNLYLDILYNQ